MSLQDLDGLIPDEFCEEITAAPAPEPEPIHGPALGSRLTEEELNDCVFSLPPRVAPPPPPSSGLAAQGSVDAYPSAFDELALAGAFGMSRGEMAERMAEEPVCPPVATPVDRRHDQYPLDPATRTERLLGQAEAVHDTLTTGIHPDNLDDLVFTVEAVVEGLRELRDELVAAEKDKTEPSSLRESFEEQFFRVQTYLKEELEAAEKELEAAEKDKTEPSSPRESFEEQFFRGQTDGAA